MKTLCALISHLTSVTANAVRDRGGIGAHRSPRRLAAHRTSGSTSGPASVDDDALAGEERAGVSGEQEQYPIQLVLDTHALHRGVRGDEPLRPLVALHP